MTTKMDEFAGRIAAKEAELAAARATLVATFANAPGGSSRRKSYGVRIDAQLRRGGENRRAIERLERELAALRREATRPTLPELDLSRLPYATHVRTAVGWYRVVKVNAKSVKVAVPPGWDDRIAITKVIEIRERPAVVTIPAIDVLNLTAATRH